MKKLRVIVVILLIVASFFCINIEDNAVKAETSNNIDQIEQGTNEQLNELDFDELQNVLDKLTESQKSIFGSSSFLEKIKQLISGEYNNEYNSFFASFMDIFFDGILSILPLLATVVAVGVLSSFVGNIKPNSNGKTLSEIIHFVCYGFIIVLVCGVVIEYINITSKTISNIKAQMDISFPILLTLMTAVGSVVSVSIYQPLVAILCGGIVNIFNALILPIFICSLVFSVVGNLSTNVKLNKFSDFFSSLYKWVIGIIFTVFTGFLAIKGISASTFDGISIRTAKYAIKSYIPLLGGYISDGFNLILASSVLIKNAVGAAGLLLLFATIIVPVVQILLFKLGLSLIAGILEPIVDSKITNFLTSISKSMMILIVTILGVAFMYVLTVGLIMCSANLV